MLLDSGYRKVFNNLNIPNPIIKKPLSKKYTGNHFISLFIHDFNPAIELVCYPQSDVIEPGIRFLPYATKKKPLELPGLGNDERMKFFIETFFICTDVEDVYIYKSRFSKSDIYFNFSSNFQKKQKIDETGATYPAFWVTDLNALETYFPKEIISSRFNLEVQSRMIEGCVVNPLQGVFIEFIQAKGA